MCVCVAVLFSRELPFTSLIWTMVEGVGLQKARGIRRSKVNGLSKRGRKVNDKFVKDQADKSERNAMGSPAVAWPKFASKGSAPVTEPHQRRSATPKFFLLHLQLQRPVSFEMLNLPNLSSMAGLQSKSAMAARFSLTAAFRALSVSTPKRAFSTTLAPQSDKKLPEDVPAYPYGPRQWYKQADTGLYGGAMIRFGNKISKGRNEGKTRRSWKPNVRRKKLWSEALQEHLFIKVTRRALRTIMNEGGLDNYLLSDRPARLKELGMFGWHLRYQVMQSPTIREQFRQQREKMGLPEPMSFEEWIKTKEEEIEAKVEERLNIKTVTKPRPKGQADRQNDARKLAAAEAEP